MGSILDGSMNISFYTVPIAFVLTSLPSAYAKMGPGKGYYDPANPRKFETAITSNEQMDKITKGRILRGLAASNNGMETLALYAAGVTAGNGMGVPASTLNQLTLAYIASRLVYNITYVFLQDNRKFAPLRSLTWMAGIGIIFTLFIKAQTH